MALKLLHAGINCGSNKVVCHVLSLGIIPLLWQLILEDEGDGETLQGGTGSPHPWLRGYQDEAKVLADQARVLLCDVEGTGQTARTVAAAGVVPLRNYLLADAGVQSDWRRGEGSYPWNMPLRDSSGGGGGRQPPGEAPGGAGGGSKKGDDDGDSGEGGGGEGDSGEGGSGGPDVERSGGGGEGGTGGSGGSRVPAKK